jgi:hypothetical protein
MLIREAGQQAALRPSSTTRAVLLAPAPAAGADADAGLRARLALVLGVDAGHDAQNRGLAGAVQAQQADFRAGEEGQGDVLDDGPVRGHDLADPDHRVNVLSHIDAAC